MKLKQLNRILFETMMVPIVALLIVAMVLALQVRRAGVTVARMQAASDNIATATLVAQLTINEENGIRGFQLTGDPVFLQAYNAAQQPLQATIAQLRDGVEHAGDNPNEVDELVLAHDTWRIAFAEPIILATRNGTDTRDTSLNLRAKNQMDRVLGLISEIIRSQTETRNQVLQQWRNQVRFATRALIILAFIVGLTVGVFARDRLRRVSHAFQQSLKEVQSNAQRIYSSEQRLRTVLSSIGEGIIVCDRKDRVEMLNTLAEELTGWTLADAAGQHLRTVYSPLNEATRIAIEPTASSFPQLPPQHRTSPEDPLANHTVLVRRDGAEFPIEQTETPVCDQEGRVAGAVIAFRDITERRQAQTTLLATEKLAVTGRLAATLAHEIHNPLDAVMNLLFLMRSNPTPEETAMFLDMASKELTRVTQISRAMLGMYRESREPVAIDMQEMLNSILMLLESQMRKTQVKLRAEFARGATVTGFPAELRQVFTNLLTNAAEASPPDTFLILRTEILAERLSFPRQPAGVAISLIDKGPGIAADVLPKLFQPFFTTKGEQGTGLGLWVSKGIIERHHGMISIDSSQDSEMHGTTVTVFLPRGESSLYQSV